MTIETLLCALVPLTTPSEDPPVELGRVRWRTDHDAAFEEARRESKPVVLLFQEVPGWATCKDFGRGPLSNPLLVEALETAFVPVLVFNNKPGRDAELLERYGEPSWNNPVVRFFDGKQKELLERRDGVYAAGALSDRMVRALEAARAEVPGYLALVREDLAESAWERAVFAMAWFWEGEARLGALPGVRATRVGWLEGHEVVDLRFDPERLSWSELLRAAREAGCADRVYTASGEGLARAKELLGDRARSLDVEPRAAKESDETYYLRRSPLRFLPLTPLQVVRLNSVLGRGADPGGVLSPRQLLLSQKIQARLERESKAFDGLERPTSIAELAAYADTLERILAER